MEEDIILAKKLLNELQTTGNSSSIVKKIFDITPFTDLTSVIPDRKLVIQEVLNIDEIEQTWIYCKPYLAPLGIFPILGTLGDHVICVGFLKENYLQVFYYDFEFQCCGKVNESWCNFINILKDCPKWKY